MSDIYGRRLIDPVASIKGRPRKDKPVAPTTYTCSHCGGVENSAALAFVHLYSHDRRRTGR